jgi:hypothetical protein
MPSRFEVGLMAIAVAMFAVAFAVAQLRRPVYE